MECISSYPFAIHLFRCRNFFILLGWSVHFVDFSLSLSVYLKGFSPFVGDPSTLRTLVYVRPRIGHVRTFTLLGRSVHFVDFSLCPSMYWACKDFHPPWVIRPLCGLNRIFILWWVHPLCGLDRIFTLWGSVHFGDFKNFHPLWMIRPLLWIWKKIYPLGGPSTLWTLRI